MDNDFDGHNNKIENGFEFSETIKPKNPKENNYNSQTKDIFSTEEFKIPNQNFNYDSDNNKIKNNKSKTVFSAIISMLIFLIVLLIILFAYLWKSGFNINFKNLGFTQQSQDNLKSESKTSLDKPDIKFEQKPEDEKQLSAETIYEQVAPSVVGVVVYDSEADVVSDPISQGSGVIIDERGYIATNSHVVNNSKKNNIKIVLHNNEELSGKVIGYDTRTDIAVIKCEKDGLKSATLGNSDQVKVGESALALGNPLGLDFASTLTRGIVSAVNRSKSIAPSNSLVKYIQTDAAINPGNSGGPLINMYGQIIGINTMKFGAAGLEGMGFAIPSNVVKDIVNDIIEKGYVSGRVRLGIAAKMISNYQAQIYDVPVGILVSKIYSGSNLTSAGVKAGDILTKINDVNITSFDAFYGELYKHKPGETISLSIFRTSERKFNSNTFNVNVTLLEDRGETQEESQLYSREQ